MSPAEIKLVDIQALDHNKLAAGRTLMAWVRTCLSMIGFGFLIYTFFQLIAERGMVAALRSQAPCNLGLVLTGLGTSVMVVAAVQHWSYLKNFRTDQPYKPWDTSVVVACLTAIVGAVMFGSILLRSGPFG